MERSTIHNKLKSLDISNKVQFNVAMHGVSEGQIIDYRGANSTLKTLIRRRLKDDDDSVVVVVHEPEKKIMETAESKPTNTNSNEKKLRGGRAASKTNGDN